MSITISPGYLEKTELDFLAKTPDSFSTVLADAIIRELARTICVQDAISTYTIKSPVKIHSDKKDEVPEVVEGLANILGESARKSPIQVHFGHGADELAVTSTFDSLRANIQVEVSALERILGITPIQINISGGLTSPFEYHKKYIQKEIGSAWMLLLGENEFYEGKLFGWDNPLRRIDAIRVNTDRLNFQVAKPNHQRVHGAVDGSCTVYGHYIREPLGIEGTFASLAIAHNIDKAIYMIDPHNVEPSDFETPHPIPDIRDGGRVIVTVSYDDKGYILRDVELYVAHKKNPTANFNQAIENVVKKEIAQYRGGEDITITVNPHGDFSVYFIDVQNGRSGVQDALILTGGHYDLGTKQVWGRCLHQATSLALPYAFGLAEAVCQTTRARYATIGVAVDDQKQSVHAFLGEIDPEYEGLRERINHILKEFPVKPNQIRIITGMGINFHSYYTFNSLFYNAVFPDEVKSWVTRLNEGKNEPLFKPFRDSFAIH